MLPARSNQWGGLLAWVRQVAAQQKQTRECLLKPSLSWAVRQFVLWNWSAPGHCSDRPILPKGNKSIFSRPMGHEPFLFHPRDTP